MVIIMSKRVQPAYRAKRKYRRLPAISVIISLLAIVGAVAIIISGVKMIVKMTDKDEIYEQLENRIYPVVMFDPLTFENPAQLDDTVLLQMSLWAALLGENRDKYTYDDELNLVVPASDLDVEAQKLFGDSVELQHQSFGDYEYNYRYVESSKTYSVPIGGQQLQYSPRVEEIKEEEGMYYLTVGYIAPKTLWNVNTTGEEEIQEADKYMIYVLKEEENGYVVTAVREVGYEENSGEEEYLSIADDESSAAE